MAFAGRRLSEQRFRRARSRITEAGLD